MLQEAKVRSGRRGNQARVLFEQADSKTT